MSCARARSLDRETFHASDRTENRCLPPDRTGLARACYAAYETGDRQALEDLVADDFAFWSPQDDGIDRATYFERCWPANETLAAFEFKRLRELGGRGTRDV